MSKTNINVGEEELVEATHVDSLAPVIRRRFRALANLHGEKDAIFKKFQAELKDLELKYQKLYAPIYDKSTKIITGAHEPSDKEAGEEKEDKNVQRKESSPSDSDIKGIPDYWQTVLLSNNIVGSTISEEDKPALSFLRDIRCTKLEKIENNEDGSKDGFALSFHFAENPFFSNTVLTKSFVLARDSAVGEYDLDHATGTEINWKAGKNLSVKKVEKKTKQAPSKKVKGKPTQSKTKTVIVEEPCETFFSFFNSAKLPSSSDDDDDEDDDEVDALMEEVNEMDYQIGTVIREEVVPHSVLLFKNFGLSLDDDDSDSDDGLEFGDEEDDEEEEEGEGEKRGTKRAKREPSTGADAEKPECKQQ